MRDNGNFEENIDAATFLRNLRFAISRAIEALESIDMIKQDRDEWHRKYDEELRRGIKHGEAMMANVLTTMLKPEQAEAAKDQSA